MNEKDLKNLIDTEAAAAESARDVPILPSTKVSRGHGRTETLQVRLTDREYRMISDYAAHCGLPVSTLARDVLLAGIGANSDTGDSATTVISRIRADLDVLAAKVS